MLAVRTRRSRRSSTSRAIRAGGASRRRSARIRTSLRGWAWRRCAGFQGDATFPDKRRVMATLKHFAAHGQPESGTNCAPVNVSMRVLRETFLCTFEAAIREGGALSVMPSYNEIDGVPSHANRWLLEDVLRGEWGFRGTVVSDYYAIRELDDRPETLGHHVAADAKAAAALAVRAGVNIELPEPDCYPSWSSWSVKARSRKPSSTNACADARRRSSVCGCSRIRTSIQTRPNGVVREPSHRTLALEAARKTITLLKNAHDVLPLERNGAQDHRRHRSQRRPGHARRLQRDAAARRAPCCRRSANARRQASRCSTIRAASITVGGSWAAGRGHARRSRGGSNEHSRSCGAGGDGRMSSCWRSAATSRRRARRGRSITWAIARASTWSAGRTSSWTLSPPPASRSSRCCSTDVRSRCETWRRRSRRFSSAGTSARNPAVPSPTWSSATSIPAASCRSRSRAPSATFPRSTITSPRRAAATCSTTSRRCSRSATA